MTTITFWGATASPFQLKMQALADAASMPWQRAPEQLSTTQALAMQWRLRRAQRRESIERLPRREAGLDEYPAVPFYTLDGKTFYYDSTGLAYHLQQLTPNAQALLPEEPTERFACQLIDEAFDEFGRSMGTWPLAQLGDNSIQTIDFGGIERVRRLELTICASGALVELVYCPTPEVSTN